MLGFTVEQDFSSVLFFTEGIAIWQPKPEEKLVEVLGHEFYKNNHAYPMELYFEVSDFELVVQALKKHGVELIHDIYTESHGQLTIRFYDPDKNIIELAEPLGVTIARDAASGMTSQELSAKHFISVEEIEKMLQRL